MSIFAELKRRNVFRVGIAYLVSTWLLVQVADILLDNIGAPTWVLQTLFVVLGVGFFITLFFAWAFEMTPEGIKREKDVVSGDSITSKTGRKLDYTIIALLTFGMAYFVWESRFQSENEAATTGAHSIAVEQDVSAETPVFGSTDENFNTEKSIAVLPFTNRSPNKDDAYFTDGVHDDLLTQLAKIDAFSVISRTSVMEYRDTAKNLKQIGEELGVANIMEGAVQRVGNRVRINVQLIDAGSDEHLWAEVYDRELTTENLFDIQSEIAQAIASALQSTLSDSEIAMVSDIPTKNVKAYELYLQGKRFALGETEIGFDTSVDLYREALKHDPDFKLAWIGLAQAYINNYWSYGGDPADREKARQAIDKAKAIDPDFPELHLAEGSYYYWGLLDYDAALENLDKAIAQMPSNAEAHMWKGWASRRAGLWDQAINSMQKAAKLNPRKVINLIEYGQTLGYINHWDEALAVIEQAYAVDPDSYWAKSYLANMLLLTSGDTERATTLTIGAQHTNELTFVYSYWETNMMAGQYDAALQIAQTWPTEWEFNRENIILREHLVAETLKIMGRDTEAREEAQKALGRLDEMKRTITPDYRFLEAEHRSYAILGERQKVAELAQQYQTTKPTDAVEDIISAYRLTQSYALAGMTDECVEALERLLSGISTISITWLELDPYFNGIRSEPAFIALLERHR